MDSYSSEGAFARSAPRTSSSNVASLHFNSPTTVADEASLHSDSPKVARCRSVALEPDSPEVAPTTPSPSSLRDRQRRQCAPAPIRSRRSRRRAKGKTLSGPDEEEDKTISDSLHDGTSDTVLSGRNTRNRTQSSSALDSEAGQDAPNDLAKGFTVAGQDAPIDISEGFDRGREKKALALPIPSGLSTIFDGRVYAHSLKVRDKLPPGQPPPGQPKNPMKRKFCDERKFFCQEPNCRNVLRPNCRGVLGPKPEVKQPVKTDLKAVKGAVKEQTTKKAALFPQWPAKRRTKKAALGSKSPAKRRVSTGALLKKRLPSEHANILTLVSTRRAERASVSALSTKPTKTLFSPR
ncbi:hypothetical protein CEK25_009552 [Fusarium fujikuroi]|nr:hypothetical protein CEK25_009552 [Fusarium fujikuroi]